MDTGVPPSVEYRESLAALIETLPLPIAQAVDYALANEEAKPLAILETCERVIAYGAVCRLAILSSFEPEAPLTREDSVLVASLVRILTKIRSGKLKLGLSVWLKLLTISARCVGSFGASLGVELGYGRLHRPFAAADLGCIDRCVGFVQSTTGEPRSPLSTATARGLLGVYQLFREIRNRVMHGFVEGRMVGPELFKHLAAALEMCLRYDPVAQDLQFETYLSTDMQPWIAKAVVGDFCLVHNGARILLSPFLEKLTDETPSPVYMLDDYDTKSEEWLYVALSRREGARFKQVTHAENTWAVVMGNIERLMKTTEHTPVPAATDDGHAKAAMIQAALSEWSPEREAMREQAITTAHALIETKLGVLTADDVRHLFTLFNTDLYKGSKTFTRFVPAFVGSTANMLVGNLDALNKWTERLWLAGSDDAIAEVLNALWSDELPGAGTSYPTVVLHVRDKDRYFPLMPGIAEGYAKLTGERVSGRKAERYATFVRGVRALRARYRVPAHAVDLMLSAVRHEQAQEAELELALTQIQSVMAHEGGVTSIAWAKAWLASCGVDGRIVRRTVIKPDVAVEVGRHGDGGASLVCWSPSGDLLASAGDDKVLRLWSMKARKVEQPVMHTGRVTSIAWSPQDDTLATGANNHFVWIINPIQKGSRRLEGHRGTVNALAWKPNGKRLASAGADGRVLIWSVARGKAVNEFDGYAAQISCLSWSADGSRLALDSDRGEVIVINPHNGDVLWQREARGARVRALAWSQGGALLVSGSDTGSVQIWDGSDGRELARDDAAAGVCINTVAWSPDGNHAAAGSSDGVIRFWRLEPAEARLAADLHDDDDDDEPDLALPEQTTAEPPHQPKRPPPASKPKRPIDPPQSYEIALDIRLLGERGCNVRDRLEPGVVEWPSEAAPLPSLREIEDYASNPPGPAELGALGRQLFEALFADEPSREHYRVLAGLARDDKQPLRLVLHMHPDAPDPGQEGAGSGRDRIPNPDPGRARCSIALYFWEAMVDPLRGHLGMDLEIRVARVLARLPPLDPPPPTSRLRAHVGFARPQTHAELGLFSEWTSFNRLQHDSDLLTLRVHPSLDTNTLRAAIHEADLFHFAGHGEAGELLLEGPGRSEERLASDALRGLLIEPLPRVVILNICYGSIGADQLISVAEAFLDRGVHAVVAMNGIIEDRAALGFADELHKRLAAGVDLEFAVQQARWRAFAERTWTWFMPVLWTRSPNSFALVEAGAAARDGFVRAELETLDRRAARLRPKVMVLDRLASGQLDIDLGAVDIDELATAVLEQVDEHAPPQVLARELDELLTDEAALERQVLRVRRRVANPASELREVASTLRRELVPQLGAAASSLPALVDALKSALAQTMVAVAPPVATITAPEFTPTAQPRRFTDSAPLASEASVAQLVQTAKGQLVLDDEIVERCVLHLLAGRHLVLAGPPGTGKSTLAKGLAAAFGFDVQLVTANPDWTTFDTIGGLAPISVRDDRGRTQIGYEVQPGCVVRAVESNWREAGELWTRVDQRGTWLVIDEMNRAPLDQAFGDLFTALVDRELCDPRAPHGAARLPIPRDFRLICTTNTADRRLLFEFSEALKRRFAFVEIPAFRGDARGLGERDKLRAQLQGRDGLGEEELGADFDDLVDRLDPIVDRVRLLHPLGLAQILDVLTFVLVARRHGASDSAWLLDVALIDNLLPLLEALPAPTLDAIACVLGGDLQRWFRVFVEDGSGSYQLDPVALRVADRLLRGLAPDLVVPSGKDLDGWETLVNTHGSILAERAAPLPAAATFVATLRALIRERDG